jgi:hypothetical protein
MDSLRLADSEESRRLKVCRDWRLTRQRYMNGDSRYADGESIALTEEYFRLPESG